MDRTTSFGFGTNTAGQRIFVDENLVAGVDGTDVLAADTMSWQEELMGIIEGFGLVGSPANLKQAYAAISGAISGAITTAETAAESYASQFNPGRYLGTIGYGANATLVIPANCNRIRVYGCGGGGGGAGINVDYGSPGNFQSGAGGGAGGFGIGDLAVVPGSSYAIVIGAGGTAGQGGLVASGGESGGAGGTTSIGPFAWSGGGGGLWQTANSSSGGTPGLAYGPLFLLAAGSCGTDGQGGSNSLVFAGNGAPGPWGGLGRAASGGGQNGQFYGSGGGGAYSGVSTYVANGGVGSGGVVFVELYTG